MELFKIEDATGFDALLIAESMELIRQWKANTKDIVNTLHYNSERQNRQNHIDETGGYGNKIAEVYMDKGHPNGPEVHILTDNAVIIVVNFRTKRLITTKFARPGQIRQLCGGIDLLKGRVLKEKDIPPQVIQKAFDNFSNGRNQW